MLQSALEPSGFAAALLAQLWWIMAGGALAIALLVLAVLVQGLRARTAPRVGRRTFLWAGGLALPLLVLMALSVYSTQVGGRLASRPARADLSITVEGNMWWWRVRYETARGSFETANEVHLPVSQPVRLTLRTADVIHSFWVPRLHGKLDMIPGQDNRLVLEAAEPGVYRGQCAEFCGLQHALMAFFVIAHPPDEFEAWLDRRLVPPPPPATPFLARGQALFLESGCGDCHSVKGTPAQGRIGPDLSDVGGRHSIGAGILPATVGSIAGWIADAQHIKPGNKMPSFEQFQGEDLRALAAWLESLE